MVKIVFILLNLQEKRIMYDLAIIGGGPAGYSAAALAGKSGLTVVLFEKSEMGGTCLNSGCIPTKTLLYSAKVYDNAIGGDKYGVVTDSVRLDFAKMIARKNKVIKKLGGGISMRMRAANVTIVKSKAIIQGKTEKGFLIKGNEEIYSVGKILLCTGAEPAIPNINGLSERLGGMVLTNREALSLDNVPQRLVVIGGGAIGIEFSAFFNSLGSDVTVIEALPEILGASDNDISSTLRSVYEKKGVHFFLSGRVVKVDDQGVLLLDKENSERMLEADRVLVSVGRVPNIVGLGLESLGVEIAGKGIRVNERMETSVEGVYAAGDVTGFSMFAHTAIREAEVAVNNMIGNDECMRYDSIPSVIFTNPEAASVGLTEKQAINEQIPYKIVKMPMSYSGRFVAENEAFQGLCKLLVKPDSGAVLGAHMVGNPSGEIIYGMCSAIEFGMTVGMLRKIVFPHPTVSEILKESIAAI